MRILLASHRYPPARGGVETWTRTLARALVGQGHEVAVLTRDDRRRDEDTPGEAAVTPPFSRRETREDVGERELAIHRVVHRHEDARGFRSTWDDPRFDAPIGTLIDAFRPDVLHLAHPDGWGRRPAEVARERGVPVVVTLHDYKWICGRGQMVRPPGLSCRRVEESRCARCLGHTLSAGPLRGLAKTVLARVGASEHVVALARRDSEMDVDHRRFPGPRAVRRYRDRAAGLLDALERAHAVTAPSAFVAGRHREAGLRRAVDVIRQGLRGRPVPPRPRAPGPLRVGWFGTPIPTKGLGLLLAAASAVPPGAVEVHVHGVNREEALREAVRANLPDLPQSATVHGPYEPDDAIELMARVDVVAVPSTWDENAPMVVEEARWARRPLLVSDRGGLPESVRDGVDGWVLPSESVEAWAESLALLAARPAAADEAGRRAAAPRTDLAMAEEYAAIYTRTLESWTP